jgi:hypothetical protein
MILDFDDSVYDDAVSGEGYRRYCNKSYKPSAYDLSYDTNIEPNDVWFVKRDFLAEFFSVIPTDCPSISVVTQHSDYEVDDAVMSMKPSCVKTVFGSNATSQRKDVVPIPLGLGPPYCLITPKANDIKKLDTRRERNRLLYVNFRVSTYPMERETAMNQMLILAKSCNSVTVADQPSDPKIVNGYLNDLIDHKFCLCPRGNGIDTHRLWEALYCRTIPIVKRLSAHHNFTDLPILFVDDWSEVTENRLHNEYDRMMNMKWNYSKLCASWWSQIFSR